jgi:single-strand DNA-binding protein
MSITAILRGNLLADPEGKTVKVKGEEKFIAELRVFSDVLVREGESLVQAEKKSEAVKVTVWSERLARDAVAVLRKGMRVKIEGTTLYTEEWHDRDSGEKRHGLRMDAEDVSLQLSRIEKVVMKPKLAGDGAAESEPGELPTDHPFAPSRISVPA